jgi:hypothetical protein
MIKIYINERTVFSTNGAIKTRWPHAERLKLNFYLSACKNQLKVDQRP